MRKLLFLLAFLASPALAQVPQVSVSTNIPTYAAANAAIANANATDVLCITGGSGKGVFVNEMHINGVASAAAVLNVSIIKRSTADTGGTPTAETIVPLNSNNPASVATVTSYAGSPTLGTTVGAIVAHKIAIATVSNANTMNDLELKWGQLADQPIALFGSSQALCVNVPATAGGSYSIYLKWTEQ